MLTGATVLREVVQVAGGCIVIFATIAEIRE